MTPPTPFPFEGQDWELPTPRPLTAPPPATGPRVLPPETPPAPCGIAWMLTLVRGSVALTATAVAAWVWSRIR